MSKLSFVSLHILMDDLQRIIYGEARGEPTEGQVAVAYTVCNRAQKSGKSVEYEANKSNQFCVYSGTMSEAGAAAKARQIAQDVMARRIGDPTGGATFFCTTSINPSWARGRTPCAVIGNHKFYKDIAPY
jgi:spore germination cell wall hydrolase CwlJ-like protein